jgi:hypothetical protein
MLIPVEVQYPNKPHSAVVVGEADDRLSARAVAKLVGVPIDCLVDGKVIRRKGTARWSLVAYVEITAVRQ